MRLDKRKSSASSKHDDSPPFVSSGRGGEGEEGEEGEEDRHASLHAAWSDEQDGVPSKSSTAGGRIDSSRARLSVSIGN
jgi:hypothetical protein